MSTAVTELALGIVADDNTGATDAAGMLTERGLRTALLTGSERLAVNPSDTRGFDALVIGTRNRSVAPAEAARATRGALETLVAAGARRFQLKYCSTFDSTREGNIGPCLDAALDTLGLTATLVCPALPANGRTVYQGHLFVGRHLLSESPLKDHPLNPMTDANLVRWLGYQTGRPVGLIDLATVRRGAEAVRARFDSLAASGVAYAVADATEDDDLATLARGTAHVVLSSGGSGITAALPAVHCPGRQPLDFAPELAALPRSTLVVSGSQSPTARAQADNACARGFLRVELDVSAVLEGLWDAAAIGRLIRDRLSAGGGVLLCAPFAGAEGIARTQARGRRLGLDAVACGCRIAEALARLAVGPVRDGLVGRLIVAGGETSGAVCAALGYHAFEVGLPLSPGVPYCFPLPHRSPLVVLKSGNFGSEDLYARVRDLVAP